MTDHTPEPWEAEQRNWKGEEVEHDWYISGDRHETYDDETDMPDGEVATSIAVVIGNRTAGKIPERNARRIVAAVNACAGLTDDQIAALPRLVAWITEPLYGMTQEQYDAWQIEFEAISAIFPKRKGKWDK